MDKNGTKYVLYDEFKRVVDTTSNNKWKEALESRSTETSKFLLSAAFEVKGISDAIDKYHLLTAALLFCQSQGKDAEQVLF